MKKNVFVGLLLVVLVLALVGCASTRLPESDAVDVPASQMVIDAPTSDLVIEADPVEEAPADTGLDALLGFLVNLSGLVPVVPGGALFFAFVVDQLKRFGVVKDGYAPLVSGALNLALYTILYFASDKQDELVLGIIQALNSLAPFVLALFVSLIGTAIAHDKLSARGLGFNYGINRPATPIRAG